jgi:AbiV family abortive infection protein
MSRASLDKLCRIAVLAFRNALRLHEDAVFLYRHASYASALGLSALSLEEVGKYSVLEDLVWHGVVEGRMCPDLEEKVIRQTYDHRYKQLKFSQDADLPIATEVALRRLRDGSVERDKQSAFYVGLPRTGKRINIKGRISSPFRVTKRQAERQITLVNDFFVVLTAGTLRDAYTVDIEEMDTVLTSELLNRLRTDWPKMNRTAKRTHNAIMRLS